MPRITKLRLGRVAYERGRDPIRVGASIFRYAATVVAVEAEGGTLGLGVVWTQLDDELLYLRSLQPVLESAIVGQDADLPFLSGSAVRAAGLRVDGARIASAVEQALFDLAGRVLNVPCYQLLGARRHAIQSYVISAEDFFLKGTADTVALAQRYVADGFKACKFHLWGDPKRDIETLRALRQTLGNDIALMLDPTSRYGRPEALAVGRVIEELGFVRFEDPLPPADAAGYRWLSRHLSVPLMANETLTWSPEQCAQAARDGAVQGFRFNVMRAGIGEALRHGAVAEGNGAELDIAAFVPRGSLEASLHVALAAPASRWFEHHGALGLDEVPGLSPGFSIDKGIATPNGAPGFGLGIDWAELERHTKWTA